MHEALLVGCPRIRREIHDDADACAGWWERAQVPGCWGCEVVVEICVCVRGCVDGDGGRSGVDVEMRELGERFTVGGEEDGVRKEEVPSEPLRVMCCVTGGKTKGAAIFAVC